MDYYTIEDHGKFFAVVANYGTILASCPHYDTVKNAVSELNSLPESDDFDAYERAVDAIIERVNNTF